MGLLLITAPSAEPITLTLAKQHLRLVHTAEDLLINSYIAAARAHLDGPTGILGRALVTQTWELVMDAFPCGPIKLPLSPLNSVVSIKYLDTIGAEQNLAANTYNVDTVSDPGWVAPVESWPSTWDGINTVRIRFICGYGDGNPVPPPLVAAILLLVGDMYTNREAGAERGFSENPTVDRLIFPFRTTLIG